MITVKSPFQYTLDAITLVLVIGALSMIWPVIIVLFQGAEVEYLDSVQGSGFSIKNPQAKTTCGCGSSFSA